MAIDDWDLSGPKITDVETLRRLSAVLDDEGPLIVEHRFYRRSRSPHWFIVTSHDALLEYLAAMPAPGDSFHVWSFARACQDDSRLTWGKVPDADGRTPRGGAY